MNAAPLRPQPAGELLGTALNVAHARYAELVFAALVLASPALLLNLVLPAQARFVALCLQTFLLNFVTAAAVVIVSNFYLGRVSDPNEVYRRVFARFWPILGAALLQWVVVALGMLLFVIPGIYLAVATFAMPVVVMLENAGAGTAFDRSRRLAEGYWWHVCLGVVAAGILVGVAQTGVMFLASLTGAVAPWMADVAKSLVTVLLAPFPVVVATLFYFDLRVRKEGFDVQALTDALGAAPARETPAW